MEQAKLKQLIFKVLKADERLWNEDKIELNQTLLLDLVENIDEKVIDLLLQEKDLREKFFVKIKDVYVFKTNDFRFFMEENKVDNSYTAYKNRIGLTDGKKFLKDTNDVVLDFPYKDCVLEGGQSTEEGTDTYFEYSEKAEQYEEKQGKRKEIFFNQVLAHDEIDRLFDAKALTNWKRFTKDGEQEVKEIKRDENGIIKENLIIKGNNLLALHSLKKQFAGKIKLIYIDPPYNTGNDGFKYNDNFNHSTWLTFMKNRLEVARELLRDDGAIFVQCDDNEGAYLKVLMDDIFGRENFINQISWLRSSSGKTISRNLPNDVDIIFWYGKTLDYTYNPVYKPLSENTKKMYSKNDEDGRGKYRLYPLQKTSSPGPETTYDYVDENGKVWKCPKKGWRMNKQKMKKLELDGRLYLDGNSLAEKAYWNERENEGRLANNLWDDIYNIQGSNIEATNFVGGQKPEKLIERMILLGTDENEIVLDYHLGSGTTCAVAHKMGRQYIGIEQMDYVETIACERMKKVIDGEQGGISRSVDWQGGGDFIYFELAKWNETAKEKILACESLKELIKFFDEMYERYFLNYNLKIKEFREKVIKEEEFKNLTLDEQKKMFVAMLDNNQMYVNKTEMADKKFGIDKEDQKLTEQFYNSEK
ncbi:MAG: DNA methyltransferase [Salinivirgaceae bacterium]|jgi:adenine-specific DNA-methyltransferase